MKRGLISVVTLAVIAAIATETSAVSRRRTVKPAVQIRSWSIAITTQGGFSGAGSGGVTVSSDGKVGILFIGDTAPRCTFDLDAATLGRISQLVAQAAPQTWVESYVPAPLRARCCDMITTSMRLTRVEDDSEAIYETRWLSAGPPFPYDLSDLIAAVAYGDASLRTRFTPLCTKTP
jgi:hypothetical protein